MTLAASTLTYARTVHYAYSGMAAMYPTYVPHIDTGVAILFACKLGRVYVNVSLGVRECLSLCSERVCLCVCGCSCVAPG